MSLNPFFEPFFKSICSVRFLLIENKDPEAQDYDEPVSFELMPVFIQSCTFGNDYYHSNTRDKNISFMRSLGTLYSSDCLNLLPVSLLSAVLPFL